MAGRKERGEDWRREKIDELRSHVPHPLKLSNQLRISMHASIEIKHSKEEWKEKKRNSRILQNNSAANKLA